MEFEDILSEVGSFGLYQKNLIIFFLVPNFVTLPWLHMGLLFMTNTPDHWCYVAEIANSKLSLDLQKRLIRPQHDLSCSMYDVNYTQILQWENLTANHSWPTKKCNEGWQYDETYYDETAVTKVRETEYFYVILCYNGHIPL